MCGVPRVAQALISAMAAASGRDRVASALLILLLVLGAAAETTEANAAVDPNQERQVRRGACYSIDLCLLQGLFIST